MELVCLPGEDRTRLGYVYSAVYYGPKLPREGWPIEGDPNIAKARPFKKREIVGLLRSHLKAGEPSAGPLRKPEFNFPLLMSYLTYGSGREFPQGALPGYVVSFLKVYQERIDGLRQFSTLLSGEIKWKYSPPELVLSHDPMVEKRQLGMKWGP